MPHPEKYFVGLLGLGMAAVGLLLALVVLAIVAVHADLLLPRRRGRTTSWLGMALLVPLALVACLVTPKVIADAGVIASFGWDAYAEGLRVVNKHGQLSDGRYLNVFWAAARGGWLLPIWFLLGLPVVAWHRHFHPGPQRSSLWSEQSEA